MIDRRRSGGALGILVLGTAWAITSCGDPIGGPSDFLGQLRVQPVFLAGESPNDLGVTIEDMRVELRRSDTGELHADTVVPYDAGASVTSWIVELASESDPMETRLELLGGDEMLYTGARELEVRAGTVGSAPLEDVEVAFRGATAERVEVTPADAVLETPGSTQQFEATAYDGEGNEIGGRTFTWSSSDPEIVTIDEAGLATGSGNGTVRIIASLTDAADTAMVTAHDIGSVVVEPAEATLDALGATVQLTATAFDGAGNAVEDAPFTWSTEDPDVAAVDDEGRVTARGGGTAEIVATSAGGAADTSCVTVTQQIDRVTVTPEEAELTALEATIELTATAFDAGGNPIPGAGFAWSTSDADVATVDDQGRVTAAGIGTAEVVAAAGGAADTAFITVTQEIVRVEVTPGAAELEALEATVQLTATAFDANDHPVTGTTFAWSTSEAAVATVDADGLATAVANGAVEIEASADGFTDAAAVTVAQKVDRIEVKPGATELNALEETAQLAANAFDANDHPIPGVVFVWSSSAAGISSVDDDGLVTAAGNGTAEIEASADGSAGAATVTVAQEAERVEVTPEEALIKDVGSTLQMSASAFDANSHPVPDASFVWSSSDGGVASVDDGGQVTAIGMGSASITAAAGEIADDAAVTVAVRDSVSYPVPDIAITKRSDRREKSLGTFTVPPHVAELGVEVRIEIELTFDNQRDEAFAVGAVEPEAVEFIADGECPVVPDDPSLGRDWKHVGSIDLAEGDREFLARHAIEFPCYEPVDDFNGANSVHFHGIRFVYYRTN